MALEIYVSELGEVPAHPAPEAVFKLFQDEFYGFLLPYLEIFRAQSGIIIDLYEDADLHGQAIVAFRDMLAGIAQETEASPANEWAVQIPKRAVVAFEYVIISKAQVLRNLHALLNVIDQAIAKQESLICLGD